MVRFAAMLQSIAHSRDIVCSINITSEIQPEQMKNAGRGSLSWLNPVTGVN